MLAIVTFLWLPLPGSSVEAVLLGFAHAPFLHDYRNTTFIQTYMS